MKELIAFIKTVADEHGDEDNGLQLHLLSPKARHLILEDWALLRADELHESLCFVDPLQLAHAQIKSTFKGEHEELVALTRYALQNEMQDYINTWLDVDYIANLRERQSEERFIDQQITEDRL